MSEVRRHRHQPPLPHAHASQAHVQPVDHLVRPDHCILKVVVVVSEDKSQWLFMLICIYLKYVWCVWVTHEEKSGVPSTNVQL